MKFRQHRGSLEDSMKTLIEVSSLKELAEKLELEGLRIEFYCNDPRPIDFKETYIISDKHGVVGFSNGKLK
jgi:hypothetical protein